MMSMKCPWIVLFLRAGALGNLPPPPPSDTKIPSHPFKAKQQPQETHYNLRHKTHEAKRDAGADYEDTSIHGDDAHQFSKPETHASGKAVAEEVSRMSQESQWQSPPPKLWTAQQAPHHALHDETHHAPHRATQHALHHALTHGAAHSATVAIPGVDYGDVKYPDLMADIDSLYDQLKAHKNDKKKAKETMKKAAKTMKKTQEAHEEVEEAVEEHVETLKKNASTIEYIDTEDCINAFKHQKVLRHLKEMHPAQLEGDPGIIDYDIERMCENAAVNGTISKRDFVSGFLALVQKRVNNKPVDCESFAYYVMSGGAFDELSDENRHLAVDNIDLAKTIERARLGPDAPPLPPPKLQDIMFWQLGEQLGKREDPADEAHEQMDTVHEALEGGDTEESLEHLKELKHKMGKAQDHLEESAASHGWSIKRHSVEAGVEGNPALENETLHMSTNDTLKRLGSSVEEQLANFDKCDKDGDGELWEKEFLVCELKKVETGVIQDLQASGKGVRSPGHHCAWRMATLTSGHLYQQTEALNEKLRMMNNRLHEELQDAEGNEKYMQRRTKKHVKETSAPAAAPAAAGAPAAMTPASPAAAFYIAEEAETAD